MALQGHSMTHYLAPAFALVLFAGVAQAHVLLQPATAEPGSDQLLRIVVGHGCNGQPTTALRVELPPELSAAKPQGKDGWTLTIEPPSGKSPSAITWRGELAAHLPGEFQIQARLPSRTGPLVLAAVQSCGEVTVRWDQPVTPGAARPEHPAPSLTLVRGGAAGGPAPAVAAGTLPKDVRMLNGAFADAAGKPLYTFDHDTMAGMSHCFEDCAALWPPLMASQGAMPFGDWTLIRREEGSAQWAYKTKPLYTYSQDRPGEPAKGTEAPNWRLAK
jgi:predicted lipoprotein with Yx(FWY)xxD motif